MTHSHHPPGPENSPRTYANPLDTLGSENVYFHKKNPPTLTQGQDPEKSENVAYER